MDFNDSVEEAAFREEARKWLEANKPDEEELKGLDEIQRAKFWQRRKYDGGWALIRFPEEYGGRGAGTMEEVIFNQEEARVVPYEHRIFTIGMGMAAPTLIDWADEADKRRLVPRIASGEDIWCQLFSEPAAGSDLAALRTRAVEDGDQWVINGQKIWTSGAQHSDWAIMVVRTDPTVPKHKGLTYFYVDMHSPGIKCKPIRQISGDAEFNEVYFTDVRVPDGQRLGEIGQGWQVSISTLLHERASSLFWRSGRPSILSKGGRSGFFRPLKELAKVVSVGDRMAIDDAHVRARLATWYVQEAGLRFTSYRALSALSRGATPEPESGIGKLLMAAAGQEMASFAMDLLEQEGVVRDSGYSGNFGTLFQDMYMDAPGGRIAGGTDEILKNILAERVLGLPQEPRMDKGMPFNKVPTGARAK